MIIINNDESITVMTTKTINQERGSSFLDMKKKKELPHAAMSTMQLEKSLDS